jgi:multidrug efflux system membrane fusion protein
MIDGLRVVQQGLKTGEVIVVNGLQRVRPGDPVTPQKVAMIEPDKSSAAPAAEGDKKPEAAAEKKQVKETAPQDKPANDKAARGSSSAKAAVR